MPNFLTSTHKKHWTFNRQQLQDLHNTKIQNFLDKASQFIPEIDKFILTPDEESKLISILTSNLLKAADHLEISNKAKATAATYFRRFLLKHYICEYDAINMMFTALFLACKTEEINIRDANNFCSHFKQSDPKRILQYEVLLISGLGFQLYVFSPDKPLSYIFSHLSSKNIPETCYTTAIDFVNLTFLTEVNLMFTPGLVAVCGFYWAVEDRIDKEDLLEEIIGLVRFSREEFFKCYQEIKQQVLSVQQEIPEFQNLLKNLIKKSSNIRHGLKKAAHKKKYE